ncbi:MAG TPA: hypothetical protein ENK24_04800 [Anaerolineae bacterium]|nr:hypothetical protein [Anaerolineae bacterium]
MNDRVQIFDDTPVIVTFLTPEIGEAAEDLREAELLSQSPLFHTLAERALAEVKNGETLSFEELLDAIPDLDAEIEQLLQDLNNELS